MAEEFDFDAWMKANNEKAHELDLLRNNEVHGRVDRVRSSYSMYLLSHSVMANILRVSYIFALYFTSL